MWLHGDELNAIYDKYTVIHFLAIYFPATRCYSVLYNEPLRSLDLLDLVVPNLINQQS